MGLNGAERDQIKNHLLALLYFLKTADPEVVLEVANSAWIREGVEFEENYLVEIQQYLLAEAAPLDFDDPQSVAVINKWVNDRTRGLIPEVVEPPIDPLTILYLINTTYFDGNWSYPFDPARTAQQTFTTLAGEEILVPMMIQNEELPYFENEQFQAVRLPYGDEKRISMSILLPRDNLSARHGRTLVGESPIRGLVVPTVSQEQGCPS
jgi:serine protease inhibitor